MDTLIVLLFGWFALSFLIAVPFLIGGLRAQRRVKREQRLKVIRGGRTWHG
jgi:hypothetical protein